jgi:hypothetical protein
MFITTVRLHNGSLRNSVHGIKSGKVTEAVLKENLYIYIFIYLFIHRIKREVLQFQFYGTILTNKTAEKVNRFYRFSPLEP